MRWIPEGTPGIHPFDSRPGRRPGLLVVVALGGFLVFQQFLAGDSVPALTLAPTSAPVASATGGPGTAPPATLDVILSGDLTIHGVTGSVAIAGQARLNGDRIEIVASLPFPFSDFGMTPPDIAGFVQVEDEATLEVLLSLEKVLT